VEFSGLLLPYGSQIATPDKDILTLHYTLKVYKYSETYISDHLY